MSAAYEDPIVPVKDSVPGRRFIPLSVLLEMEKRDERRAKMDRGRSYAPKGDEVRPRKYK